MIFGLRRRMAALAFALALASGSVPALAAARGPTPSTPSVEQMRAALSARAEAALKIQGGSRILLKVDAEALREAVLIELRDETRRLLREGRIPFGGAITRDGSVEARVRDAKDLERTLKALAPLGAADGKADVAAASEGLIRITPTEPEFIERLHTLRNQSIGMIEQRLNSIGIAAPGVQPDGDDGIRVLLPGVRDPERLGAMLSRKAQVTFRLIDASMDAAEALRRDPPSGSEVLYARASKDPHLLLTQAEMDGRDIIDASPGFDRRTNQPIATFRFNPNGTRRLAEITRDNVGREFAIVVDDEVVSASVIREPIIGGSVQISGNLTIEDANTIAMLVRSATLPGRLSVVVQQTVEPESKAGKE